MTPAFDPDLNAAIVLLATHAIALIVGLGLGSALTFFIRD
jgi:hypothetical protein